MSLSRWVAERGRRDVRREWDRVEREESWRVRRLVRVELRKDVDDEDVEEARREREREEESEGSEGDGAREASSVVSWRDREVLKLADGDQVALSRNVGRSAKICRCAFQAAATASSHLSRHTAPSALRQCPQDKMKRTVGGNREG